MLTIESLPFEQLQNISTCSNSICYNLAQAAPVFSQLAAILASFVFGAIILALGTPPKNKTVKDISLPLLSSFTAFVSLLISCYLFGDIAGQEGTVSLFISSLAPTSVFSLAALLLMLSIAWYLHSYGAESLVISGVYWIIQSVILMLVAYMIFSLGDAFIIVTKEVWSTPLFNNPDYNTIVISMLGLFVLFFLPWGIAHFIRHRWKEKQEDNSSPTSSLHARATRLALLISVILTIVFTTADAIYVEFPQQQPNPQYIGIMWIVMLSIVTLLFFFLVPYQVGLPYKLEESKEVGSKQVAIQEPSQLTGIIQPQKRPEEGSFGKWAIKFIPSTMPIIAAAIAIAVPLILKLGISRRNKTRIL